MTKLIFITGGSRGIGAATARLAAARGYDVAISYLGNVDAAKSVVAAVEAHGRKALAVKADTGKPDEIRTAFAAVDRAFGRLDVFFNNAGIFCPVVPFMDIAAERLIEMMAVNTTGAFIAAQEAARRLSTKRGGAGGWVDYGVSKAAVDGLTIGMAKELAAEGVRVNAVRPGLIDTDIHATAGDPTRVARLGASTPMQRGGTADEVAEAVLWLASEQASYVTGMLLDVAGGRGL